MTEAKRRPVSQRLVAEVVREAAARAGITHPVTPMTLRHTCATHLVQHDVNLVVIRDLLGHRQITSTQIYLHTTAHDMKVLAANHPLGKLAPTIASLIEGVRLPIDYPPRRRVAPIPPPRTSPGDPHGVLTGRPPPISVSPLTGRLHPFCNSVILPVCMKGIPPHIFAAQVTMRADMSPPQTIQPANFLTRKLRRISRRFLGGRRNRTKYTYDGEGNVLTKTTISTGESVEYTWDHRNRLTKVTYKNSGGTW